MGIMRILITNDTIFSPHLSWVRSFLDKSWYWCYNETMIEGKLIRQTGGAAGKIDFIYGAFGMIRNEKSCEPKTIEFVNDADLYYAIQHMTMLVTYDKRKKV